MAIYYVKHLPEHPKASSSGCVYEHVLIAEKVLGKYLPEGAEIHHVDENPLNNAHKNLVICQNRAYHKLLHVRARVLRAGGKPGLHGVCSICKKAKLVSEFNACRNNQTGVQKYCRLCQKEIFAQYYKMRQAK